MCRGTVEVFTARVTFDQPDTFFNKINREFSGSSFYIGNLDHPFLNPITFDDFVLRLFINPITFDDSELSGSLILLLLTILS